MSDFIITNKNAQPVSHYAGGKWVYKPEIEQVNFGTDQFIEGTFNDYFRGVRAYGNHIKQENKCLELLGSDFPIELADCEEGEYITIQMIANTNYLEELFSITSLSEDSPINNGYEEEYTEITRETNGTNCIMSVKSKFYNSDITEVLGKECTASMWLKLKVAHTLKLKVILSEDVFEESDEVDVPANRWFRLQHTFMMPTEIDMDIFSIMPSDFEIDVETESMCVRDFKLELGNKATTWVNTDGYSKWNLNGVIATTGNLFRGGNISSSGNNAFSRIMDIELPKHTTLTVSGVQADDEWSTFRVLIRVDGDYKEVYSAQLTDETTSSGITFNTGDYEVFTLEVPKNDCNENKENYMINLGGTVLDFKPFTGSRQYITNANERKELQLNEGYNIVYATRAEATWELAYVKPLSRYNASKDVISPCFDYEEFIFPFEGRVHFSDEHYNSGLSDTKYIEIPPLYGLSEVQDILHMNKEQQKIWLERKVKVIDLNGTESWEDEDGIPKLKITDIKPNGKFVCNKIINKKVFVEGIPASSTPLVIEGKYIKYDTSEDMTAQQMKDLLAENPCTLVYELEVAERNYLEYGEDIETFFPRTKIMSNYDLNDDIKLQADIYHF